MLTEMGAISIKIEDPAGSEAVTDQDIYVEDIKINPTGTFIERNGPGAFHGPETTGIIGGRSGKCTFTTGLRTSGSTALDPGLAILLQACNYAKTVEVYTIAKIDTQKTITIEVWQGAAAGTSGLLKVLYGAAGTFKMRGEAGKRILFDFDFDGIYKTVVDETVPAYAPSGNVIMWDGGTFSIMGESHKISKFTFDAGNIVVPRHDVAGPGGIGYYHTTRPEPTASWDPEADLVGGDDTYGRWIAGTTSGGGLSLAMTDGTDTVTLTGATVQYMEIPEALRDNKRINEINAKFLENHATVPTMAKFAVT